MLRYNPDKKSKAWCRLDKLITILYVYVTPDLIPGLQIQINPSSNSNCYYEISVEKQNTSDHSKTANPPKTK